MRISVKLQKTKSPYDNGMGFALQYITLIFSSKNEFW
jgi:hypothetical protein